MSTPTELFSAAPLAPPRVTPHARHAFGGIWRLAARRFFAPGYWVTLAGMLALLVVFSIPAAPHPSAAAKGLIPWAAGFYVCFVLPLLTFVSAAGAIRDDFGAGTVDYVFTRPVRRPHYIASRFLAQMAISQIDFIFGLATIIGLGVYHHVPGLWAAVPVLFVGQVVGIFIFSAFGFLCGTITSRYVIFGLAYAGLVEVGLGNVPTQINQISLVRQLLGILRPILGDDKGALTRLAQVSNVEPVGIIGLLVGVGLLMVGISAIIFNRREFAGSGRDV